MKARCGTRILQALAVWSYLLGGSARSQDTELISCLPDSRACYESEGELLEVSCGQGFYFHHGRLSWPPLRAVGPITVSVKVKHHWSTFLPLYVEILTEVDSTGCSTGFYNFPVLVTEGTPDCGGAWYSVGPIDMSRFTWPGHSLYTIQVEFLDGDPVGYLRSPGFACVRVNVSTPVKSTTWANVKRLYRQ